VLNWPALREGERDGRTDGQTDGQTDGRTDVTLYGIDLRRSERHPLIESPHYFLIYNEALIFTSSKKYLATADSISWLWVALFTILVEEITTSAYPKSSI
jgi:hypothetical protein